MTLSKMRLSKLRRYHFVDINDLDVGSLEDVTLDSRNLTPKHLILGSNFFEELLEEMGKKDNIDEIAPIDSIKEVDGNFIVLGEPVDTLKTTDTEGSLPDEYKVLKYSQLCQYKVRDANGDVELDLIDLEIQGEKSRLIFNYPEIHHELMADGFMQRFEISFLVSDLNLENETIIVPSDKASVKEKVKSEITPKMKGKSTIVW